jgi:DHA1 family bicyclomycin/chloramphenicol resistance-like MFS transporter
MNVHTPGPGARADAPLMSERRVSLVGALMVIVGPLSIPLFTPAMPELVRVFGTTESMVKMTLSAYFAGFAIMQLVCGPLSDAYGRKPVTVAFMAIYVLASALAVLAPTVETLIAARFLQGIGAAVGAAVSRAVVRDLFTGEASNRIMNLITLIMGLGPALAPTLGGVLLEVAGWQAIFLFMLFGGIAVTIAIHLMLVETTTPDPSRFRPVALARSYRVLIVDRYFMLASVVLAGSLGAFFTQATVMPFILMDRVGLSPFEFGIVMLLQTLPFFFGGIIFRFAMRRHSAQRLVKVGMIAMGIGYTGTAASLLLLPPTTIGVMVPIMFFSFGVAFIMPAVTTATVAPFPHMAGAAAALSGFVQMGGGFAGGVVVALIGDPVTGMATIVPLMGWAAIIAWLVWRRLPEPALAKVVLPQPDEPL